MVVPPSKPRILIFSAFLLVVVHVLIFLMTIFKKIKKILDADQRDRKLLFEKKLFDNKKFIKRLKKIDRIRVEKAKKILKEAEEKRVLVSKRTLYYIGVILQHSTDINDQRLGVRLAQRSTAMGSKEADKLYQAAVDRILIQKTGFQKYGSHYKVGNGKKIPYPQIRNFSQAQVDKVISK